jgi:hypothetical protein
MSARRVRGRIQDVFGVWFDISEFRGTRHGFDVVLGCPRAAFGSSGW